MVYASDLCRVRRVLVGGYVASGFCFGLGLVPSNSFRSGMSGAFLLCRGSGDLFASMPTDYCRPLEAWKARNGAAKHAYLKI